MTKKQQERRILILEPFYGGSHKRFLDTILPLSVDYETILSHTNDSNAHHHHQQHHHNQNNHSPSKQITTAWNKSTTSSLSSTSSSSITNKWPPFKFTLYGMTAKKWHWRARTSALYYSRVIVQNADEKFNVLFVTSILNLAELIALRPDIARIPEKIIYFHENQLVYPIQEQKERDFQYGYNQILSCLVADQIVFNSKYNKDSFFGEIKTFLKMMPDYRPPDLDEMISTILKKSHVLYYPILFSSLPLMHAHRREKQILHIVWPHRWEHDKNPQQFFQILFQLKKEKQIPFKLTVLGQSFSQIPSIFEEAKTILAEEIVHWGFVESRQDYYDLMAKGNVVISTALHEFFGISMLEAAYCGCYPLCPSRLVYPEIFPNHYLYETEDELLTKLEEFGRQPSSIPLPLDIAFELFDWIYIQDEYRDMFNRSTKPLTRIINQSGTPTPSTSNSNVRSSSPTPSSTSSVISTLTSKLKSIKIPHHHHNHKHRHQDQQHQQHQNHNHK